MERGRDEFLGDPMTVTRSRKKCRESGEAAINTLHLKEESYYKEAEFFKIEKRKIKIWRTLLGTFNFFKFKLFLNLIWISVHF